ncbi:hypothetical protein CXG81DRAFT_27825 [Caulochytrium protostelioides]|uniref:Hydrophobin n=1 Tax=Caulochytrium protostelioides TaxID=1555241 RepID=A0A4P9X324_9FUNG|nr:hypothetical protein CXG81DRAFT_27825 [Caulochytrium protostelioides]|eukprot:RKO99406.1 hypothetical protein CXG81DRAFT_27825 [Caulochytrium protostelioides]
MADGSRRGGYDNYDRPAVPTPTLRALATHVAAKPGYAADVPAPVSTPHSVATPVPVSTPGTVAHPALNPHSQPKITTVKPATPTLQVHPVATPSYTDKSPATYAAGYHEEHRGSGSTCGNGDIHCCDQTIDNDSSGAGLFGNLLGGLTAGVNCVPITAAVLGVAGQSACKKKTLCCSGDTIQQGLINFGCTNLGLDILG